MSDPAPALRVIGIEKSFPGVQALKRASLDVHRGEIHGLVGENGAGKSTLMRVLAGVFRPTAGEILLDEKPVQFASPRDAQDHGIAMVYQDTRLVPDLDVAQNIWLGREPGNRFFVDRRRMEASAREILDRLGLRIRLDASVRSLAFDERQIVEIARALTTDPPFLILDEPTSGLDRGETERLFVILRQLQRGRQKPDLHLSPASGGALARRPDHGDEGRRGRRHRRARRGRPGSARFDDGRPVDDRRLSAPRCTAQARRGLRSRPFEPRTARET